MIFDLLLSLGLLCAMGALGVGLLTRPTPFLDPLERLSYGAALGVVVGSLGLLALGSLFGLSRTMVLVVGVACLAGATWLIRGNRPTEGWAPAAIGLTATLILGLLLLRFIMFWSTAVAIEDDGLWTAQVNLWGDWAQHLGDVSSFVYGDNLPPRQTRLVDAPLAYHYLTSVTVAAMVELGLSAPAALSLHSLAFTFVIVFALFSFVRRFTADREAAAIAVLLFLVGGGLGWTLTAQEMIRSDGPLSVLMERPWDRDLQGGGNFRWLNVFFSSIAPQRAYLYGIPLFGLIMTLLLQAIRSGAARWFLVAGAVAGLLPFAHLGTMLALAIVTPIMFLRFPGRGWIGFFAIWVVIGLPQVLVQQGGSAGAMSAFRWAPGWVAAPDAWLWFWFKNLGLFLPLLILALGSTSLIRQTPRRMLWCFMALFVVANLFVFQPWDWDNTKLLVFWYLASCVFVSALLTWAWRRFPALPARMSILLILGTLLLSGALQHWHQLRGLDRNRLLTHDELLVADLVRGETPADAVFLTGLQHNHPIHVMAGRRVVMGFPGWLWSQGYDYRERREHVNSMYALSAESEGLFDRYHVDFVVLGPYEREQLGADPDRFRSRFRRIIETETYEVFRVSRPASD